MLADNDLLELYTDLSRQHLSHVERHVGAFGIHAGQGAVISALGRHGPCTQKELTQIRRVSAPTISVMISRMTREGLVKKDTIDGRTSLISLTEKGERMCQLLAEDRIGEPESIFFGLTREDKEYAEKIFRTISDNLQRIAEQETGRGGGTKPPDPE